MSEPMELPSTAARIKTIHLPASIPDAVKKKMSAMECSYPLRIKTGIQKRIPMGDPFDL